MSTPQSSLRDGDIASESGGVARQELASAFLDSDQESDWEDIAVPSKQPQQQASVFLTPHLNKDMDATWHSLIDDDQAPGESHMLRTEDTQACMVEERVAPNSLVHHDEFYESESDHEGPIIPEARSIEADDSDQEEDVAAVQDKLEDQQQIDLTPPSSPMVDEMYLDGGEANALDAEHKVDEKKEDVKEDESEEAQLSLLEILRTSPPPPQPCTSFVKTCCSSSTKVQDDDDEPLLRSFETFRLVLAGLAVGVFLSYFTFGLGSVPSPRPFPSSSSAASAVFDVPAAFLSGFAREATLCEKSCCFSLFILTGDNAAHEGAVLKAMNEVRRFRRAQARPLVWTTEQLLAWTTTTTTEKNYGKKRKSDSLGQVILVKNADVLDTAEVQRIIRFGQRQCRGHPRSSGASKILVLSTSFGSDKLDDPDEVFSDRFVLDVKRRDWFVVPEIVLNFHGIVHGIRGKRPQTVFEEFLRAHRRSRPDSIVNESELECLDNSSMALDRWLETKGETFAWTESARKVLASKVSQFESKLQVRAWLDMQYSEWTKNGSCEAVLFRSSVSDVRAFTVACSSAFSPQAS